MKLNKIILTIFSVLMMVNPGLFAQSEIQLKEFKGVVYKYNSKNRIVENKANHLMQPANATKIADSNSCRYSANQKTEYYLSLYKKVFSKVRAEELKGCDIGLIEVINSSGTIVEIRFALPNCFDKITTEEIYCLEKILKSANLKFESSCDASDLYYILVSSLKFRNLYDNYDRLP